MPSTKDLKMVFSRCDGVEPEENRAPSVHETRGMVEDNKGTTKMLREVRRPRKSKVPARYKSYFPMGEPITSSDSEEGEIKERSSEAPKRKLSPEKKGKKKASVRPPTPRHPGLMVAAPPTRFCPEGEGVIRKISKVDNAALVESGPEENHEAQLGGVARAPTPPTAPIQDGPSTSHLPLKKRKAPLPDSPESPPPRSPSPGPSRGHEAQRVPTSTAGPPMATNGAQVVSPFRAAGSGNAQQTTNGSAFSCPELVRALRDSQSESPHIPSQGHSPPKAHLPRPVAIRPAPVSRVGSNGQPPLPASRTAPVNPFFAHPPPTPGGPRGFAPVHRSPPFEVAQPTALLLSAGCSGKGDLHTEFRDRRAWGGPPSG